MKKGLLVLLCAAVSASAAHAIKLPKLNVQYNCQYENYYGPASDPGWSKWINPVGNTYLFWVTEQFKVSYLSGQDNHRVAWAKPVDFPALGYTRWEFTDGPVQCKDTHVSWTTTEILFQGCTDGHFRICYIPQD